MKYSRRRNFERTQHLRTLGIAILALCGAHAAIGQTLREPPRPLLPKPLVHLRDIDPSIEQDMRYATANNFTGAKVDGYNASECILTLPAARALSAVQADLARQKLSLKVYDCYRPERAVRAFGRWAAATPRGADPGRYYYPKLERRQLIASGYIAAVSQHSIGTTIDLTLVRIAPPAGEVPATQPKAPPAALTVGYESCTAPVARRLPDTSVDMGTSYDCFDSRSHTRSAGLTAEQQRWRATLVTAMARHGFRNYAREWWHFTFGGGDGRSHDVPIGPPAR